MRPKLPSDRQTITCHYTPQENVFKGIALINILNANAKDTLKRVDHLIVMLILLN